MCVLPPEGRLTIWVATDALARLSIQGAHVQGEPIPVQGGRQIKGTVDPTSENLTVEATAQGRVGTWSLGLSRRAKPDWVSRVEGQIRENAYDVASQALLGRLGSGNPDEQTEAHHLLGQIAYQKDDFQVAIQHYQAALAGFERAKMTSRACREAAALSFLFVFQARRFAEAQKVVEAARPAPWDASSLAVLQYHRSLVASELGDLRTALESIHAAAQTAERAGLDLYGRDLQDLQALLLLDLGRREEAIRIYDRLLDSLPVETSPCTRARFLANRGLAGVLSWEAGESPTIPPERFELQALALLAKQGPCERSDSLRTSLQIDLAVSYLHQGRVQEAADFVRQAASSESAHQPLLASWIADLEARLALARGQPGQALRLYQTMRTRAGASLDPQSEWRATLGVGQALVALGRLEQALTSFGQADGLSEHSMLQIAVGQGRPALLAQRQRATQERVHLLLRLGRKAEAFRVVRLARVRTYRELDRSNRLAALSSTAREEWARSMAAYWQARDQLESQAAKDWGLAASTLKLARQGRQQRGQELDQLLDHAFSKIVPDGSTGINPGFLRPPGPGELVLLVYPGRKGWLGFAQDPSQVRVEPLGEMPVLTDRAGLARFLLTPFQDLIDRNHRLRVLAWGPVETIDFHALPYRGEVLLAHKQVVYSLDMAENAPDQAPMIRRATLIADPEGNLPRAGLDLQIVEPSLRAQSDPWEVTSLIGEAVTLTAARRLLAQSEFLHFAGHAEFGGVDGWNSGLRFHHGERFGLAELFALEHVPALVVLLGCQTARVDPGLVGGLGIAQAFLASGSQMAIASSRPLEDELASLISQKLYSNLGSSVSPPEQGLAGKDLGAKGLEKAFREALLQIYREQPDANWASLRVMNR